MPDLIPVDLTLRYASNLPRGSIALSNAIQPLIVPSISDEPHSASRAFQAADDLKENALSRTLEFLSLHIHKEEDESEKFSLLANKCI